MVRKIDAKDIAVFGVSPVACTVIAGKVKQNAIAVSFQNTDGYPHDIMIDVEFPQLLSWVTDEKSGVGRLQFTEENVPAGGTLVKSFRVSYLGEVARAESFTVPVELTVDGGVLSWSETIELEVETTVAEE